MTRTAIPNYDQIILADKPVGYWPLDDPDTSTIFRDISGNGLHATILNATGGRMGDGGRLTRLGSVVEWGNQGAGAAIYGRIADSVLLRPSKVSLEAWLSPVNFISIATSVRYLFGKTVADNDFIHGIILGITSGVFAPGGQGSVPYFCVNAVTGNFLGSITYPGGTFYLVGTYDGVNLNTYINGVQIGAGVAEPLGVIDTTGAPAYIFRGDTARVHGGAAARLAMYNYALTQAQITAHYNAGHV